VIEDDDGDYVEDESSSRCAQRWCAVERLCVGFGRVFRVVGNGNEKLSQLGRHMQRGGGFWERDL